MRIILINQIIIINNVIKVANRCLHTVQTTMSGSQQRWFVNPFSDFSNESEVKIHPDGVKMQAMNLIQRIFKNADGEMDGGIYTGPAGLAYTYLHVQKILTDAEKAQILPFAQNALSQQIVYYDTLQTKRGLTNDAVAFLLGKAGVDAVGAIFAGEMGDLEGQEKFLKAFVNVAKICKPINFLKCGGDELLVGRAGYLCGALWLQQRLGHQPVPRQDLKDIWNAMIESGKNYSTQHNSPCPLMYSYYNTEYLGAAHGVSGIIQMLLSFPAFMAENPAATDLIKGTLDFYLTLQDEHGNFPCAMDEIGRRRRNVAEDLVHWCHGAPGAVYMFAKAYLHFGDKKYLDATLKCGEVVWQRGLLKKGPGICHGVAGNGYVFLIIYNLLQQKEQKHLYRAYKFTEFLSNPTFVKKSRQPDSPYSLYEGSAGTVCFLADIINPTSAEFPFFNIYNNYTSGM